MKKIFVLCMILTIAVTAYAQQKEIEAGLKLGKNSACCYTAYPYMRKLTVKKANKWFLNNPQFQLIAIEEVQVKQFGYVKSFVKKIDFIRKLEEDEYRLNQNMLTALRAGKVRDMTTLLKKNPNVAFCEGFVDEVARAFVKNYDKCIDMRNNNGSIYTHTAGSAQIKSKFYRSATPEELTLEEDMREFLLACPQCRNHNSIKRSVENFTEQVKEVDFLYYFEIFHDYGSMSQSQIEAMDERTFQAATTKRGCKYYLQLFPQGRHVEDVKSLINGGLYELQARKMEKAKEEALKVIANLKGFGLSQDVVAVKDLLSAFWSGVFGGSTTKTIFSHNPKFADMLRTAHDFKQDFANDDPEGKVQLANFVIQLTAIIDGLWVGDVRLESSVTVLGLWRQQDAWEGYIQDGDSFWGTECTETPKCTEVRVKIETALNILKNLIESDVSPVDVFTKAHSYMEQRYSYLISMRDNNQFLCREDHEARRRAIRAERCAGCTIDWAKTFEKQGKIFMKNGNEYEYTYSGGKWRIPNLLWFDTKCDSYQEMLTEFVKECIIIECKE
jgi:hypothetical protein